MPGDHYELSGLSVPADLERLHQLLERASVEHPHVPSSDVMMFETAVMELANNVVEHGRPTGRVVWQFRFDVRADALEAQLSDNGVEYEGWDPEASHEMPGPLAESGRGLALAEAVLDELGYRRTDGVNVWTMLRRWAP